MNKAILLLMLLAAMGKAKADDVGLWLTTGESSHHVNEGAHHYRENNSGVGLEWNTTKDWGIVVGAYKNSLFRNSAYAGIKWTPWHPGSLDVGLTFIGVSGYTRNDSLIFAPLPTVSYNWKWVGVNIFVVPTIVTALQLKIRMP